MEIKNIEERMEKAVEVFKEGLNKVRTGRANPTLLNGIEVDYYGSPTPINQIASISIQEGKTVVIKPYDASSLKDIERAINEANLGINPTNNGEVIILTVPQLTEDTRRKYAKEASTMGEDAKVALREARQAANDKIKKDEAIPEDEEKRLLDEVQKLIDKYNKEVDVKVSEKEEELMQV